MRLTTTCLISTAALALAACSEQAADQGTGEGNAAAATEVAAMTDEEKKQAKKQCQIAAIVNGGTNEQAKALCDCTIETLAVGRSGEELEVLDAETSNAALNQCAQELDML